MGVRLLVVEGRRLRQGEVVGGLVRLELHFQKGKKSRVREEGGLGVGCD